MMKMRLKLLLAVKMDFKWCSNLNVCCIYLQNSDAQLILVVEATLNQTSRCARSQNEGVFL